MSELATTAEDAQRDTDTGGELETRRKPVPAALSQTYANVLEALWLAKEKKNSGTRESGPWRKLADTIPLGVYEGWTWGQGDPAEIADMDEIERVFAEELKRPLPKKKGNPPILLIPPPGYQG